MVWFWAKVSAFAEKSSHLEVKEWKQNKVNTWQALY